MKLFGVKYTNPYSGQTSYEHFLSEESRQAFIAVFREKFPTKAPSCNVITEDKIVRDVPEAMKRINDEGTKYALGQLTPLQQELLGVAEKTNEQSTD